MVTDPGTPTFLARTARVAARLAAALDDSELCLLLPTPGRRRWVAQAATAKLASTPLARALELAEHPMLERAVETRAPVVGGPEVDEGGAGVGLPSWLTVPLLGDGQVAGLAVVGREGPRWRLDGLAVANELIREAAELSAGALGEGPAHDRAAADGSRDALTGRVEALEQLRLPGIVAELDDALRILDVRGASHGPAGPEPLALSVVELFIHSERGPDLLAAAERLLADPSSRFEAVVEGRRRVWQVELRPRAGSDAGVALELEAVAASRTLALARSSAHFRRAEIQGRFAARVAREVSEMMQGLADRFDRIDEVAGDRAEVQDELIDGRALVFRGMDLTRQLTAYGRDAPPRLEPLDLASRLARWWPLLQGTLGRDRPLELALRPPASVRGDERQLELALVNLCLNARDATAPGDVVRLAVGPGESEGEVTVELHDSGEGMPAEVLARADEVFFTTKRNAAGLGLAAARAIVEAHGGRLELASAPGEGTRVRVHLPEGGALVDPRELPNAAAGEPIAALIVDDERLIARWMRRSLLHKGCEVQLAATLAAAGKALAEGEDERRPQLVIVAADLPDGDGEGFAQELAVSRPELAVIVAAGFSGRPAAASTIPLPRLHKPFSTRQFDVVVGTQLARLRGDRHGAAGP